MAEWPANGDTDWNTKMLAYLAVEHNTDGTHNILANVDSVNTKVYTKYITGILPASANANIAHGITGIDNILSITAYAYNSSLASYVFAEISAGVATNGQYTVSYDGTNVMFLNVGSLIQGQKYRIKIDYIL